MLESRVLSPNNVDTTRPNTEYSETLFLCPCVILRNKSWWLSSAQHLSRISDIVSFNMMWSHLEYFCVISLFAVKFFVFFSKCLICWTCCPFVSKDSVGLPEYFEKSSFDKNQQTKSFFFYEEIFVLCFVIVYKLFMYFKVWAYGRIQIFFIFMCVLVTLYETLAVFNVYKYVLKISVSFYDNQTFNQILTI